jgi:hypothetical protein
LQQWDGTSTETEGCALWGKIFRSDKDNGFFFILVSLCFEHISGFEKRPIVYKPINPHDSFFGGRVKAFKMFVDDKVVKDYAVMPAAKSEKNKRIRIKKSNSLENGSCKLLKISDWSIL